MILSKKIAGFPTWGWLAAGALGIGLILLMRSRKAPEDSGAVSAIPVAMGQPDEEQAVIDWTPLGLALAALGAGFYHPPTNPGTQPAPVYAAPNSSNAAASVAYPPTAPASSYTEPTPYPSSSYEPPPSIHPGAFKQPDPQPHPGAYKPPDPPLQYSAPGRIGRFEIE